MTSRVNVH